MCLKPYIQPKPCEIVPRRCRTLWPCTEIYLAQHNFTDQMIHFSTSTLFIYNIVFLFENSVTESIPGFVTEFPLFFPVKLTLLTQGLRVGVVSLLQSNR